MTSQRLQRVRNAFDRAAGTYDAHANVQRIAARRVADLALSACRREAPRVLEIGCGTGYVAREYLSARGTCSDYLCTDIAPAMVQACRERLAGMGLKASFSILDGENPNSDERFDLIVSSLAFQWFVDLKGAIGRLAACLNPGGVLVFSTLGRRTFSEWRSVLDALALPCGTPRYPESADLLSAREGVLELSSELVSESFPDGKSFLRSLKSIGAGVPEEGSAHLTAAELRLALRTLEEQFSARGEPVRITYEVLYGVLRHEAES